MVQRYFFFHRQTNDSTNTTIDYNYSHNHRSKTIDI